LSNTCSIAYFRAHTSEAKARALMVLMLTDVINFFNTGQSMSAIQVAQTADLILNDDDFVTLKIDDYKLCFNLVKKGKIGGQIYRIDGLVVMNWLNEYVSIRACEAMKQSIHEAEQYKNDRTNLLDKIPGCMSFEEYKYYKKSGNMVVNAENVK
jgi:hypothetical protein